MKKFFTAAMIVGTVLLPTASVFAGSPKAAPVYHATVDKSAALGAKQKQGDAMKAHKAAMDAAQATHKAALAAASDTYKAALKQAKAYKSKDDAKAAQAAFKDAKAKAEADFAAAKKAASDTYKAANM